MWHHPWLDTISISVQVSTLLSPRDAPQRSRRANGVRTECPGPPHPGSKGLERRFNSWKSSWLVATTPPRSFEPGFSPASPKRDGRPELLPRELEQPAAGSSTYPRPRTRLRLSLRRRRALRGGRGKARVYCSFAPRTGTRGRPEGTRRASLCGLAPGVRHASAGCLRAGSAVEMIPCGRRDDRSR